MGKTWWERSLVMATETGKTVRDAFKDTWQAFSRAKISDQQIPGPSKGPDIDLSR
jgi:hypothetical protein